MESSRYYIWLKRFIPLVIVAGIWIGYWQITDHLANEEYKNDHDVALITAQLWIAGAKYRADTPAYHAYRDSVLAAGGLTTESIKAYADKYQDRPDKNLRFSNMINTLVDSLYLIEDSLRKINNDTIVDSTAGVETP